MDDVAVQWCMSPVAPTATLPENGQRGREGKPHHRLAAR